MTAPVSEVPAVRPGPPERRIPGELGIWGFISGDLVLFSLLFFLFLKYRAADPELFTASQGHLDQNLGLLNTLLMLTSSWMVASAVRAARRQQGLIAQRCFAIALACGAGFVVVKYVEYSAKVEAGFTPVSDDFFMFYFCYTGIHLIHVLIGMGVLTAMTKAVGSGDLSPTRIRNIESGATFWHLVDLLWIVLFALLYLVGQS